MAIVALSSCALTASADSSKETPITLNIPAYGLIHIGQDQTVGNLTLDIWGKAGATGSVSTTAYTTDPHSNASRPSNQKMGHYVLVTFNMKTSDFKNATLTFGYTSSDVAGVIYPNLYKYVPSTNKYVQLWPVVNSTAKTVTYTLTGNTETLFAIGGTIAPTPTPSPTAAPTATPTPTPPVTPTPSPAPTPTPVKYAGSMETQPNIPSGTIKPTNPPTTKPTSSPTATPTVAPTDVPVNEQETTISLSIWAWIIVAIETITGFILVCGIYMRQHSVGNSKKIN